MGTGCGFPQLPMPKWTDIRLERLHEATLYRGDTDSHTGVRAGRSDPLSDQKRVQALLHGRAAYRGEVMRALQSHSGEGVRTTAMFQPFKSRLGLGFGQTIGQECRPVRRASVHRDPRGQSSTTLEAGPRPPLRRGPGGPVPERVLRRRTPVRRDRNAPQAGVEG